MFCEKLTKCIGKKNTAFMVVGLGLGCIFTEEDTFN
jgi:hypothetical protein